tara:strand:+ start:263 stop:472 length:210 start_codon:yes stop_codon:yes gene_type:complete
MAEIMVHVIMNTDNEAFRDKNNVEVQRILQNAIQSLDLNCYSSKKRLLDINGNYVGKLDCFVTEEEFDE